MNSIGQKYQVSYLEYAENQYGNIIPQKISQETEIFLPSHELIIKADGDFFEAKEGRNTIYSDIGSDESIPYEEVSLSEIFIEQIANPAKIALQQPKNEREAQKIEAIKSQIRLYFQNSHSGKC